MSQKQEEDQEEPDGLRADVARLEQAVLSSREDLHQLMRDLGARLPLPGRTFGELAADWLRRISKRRVCPENEERHVRHMAPLAGLCERELTKGAIDELFGTLLEPAGRLSAATVNKLRSTGSLIIRDAQGNGVWASLNPFDLVRRFRQPKRVYLTLTLPEVVRLLPRLRPDRRRLVKTIILVGMRPGEALGLLKTDVDLEHRMLRVRRSHGRDQTKTGKEREFPIPDELLEDLSAAIASSPSDYVFPKPDGSRQRSDTKLAIVLRTAIKAARILVGYQFLCRKYACHFEGRVVRATEDPAPCPECGKPMWSAGVPKPLRFYDLRHTCATLHRKAGCDPLVVREMMGHGSKNQTDATYTHLDPEYQRAELNKVRLRLTARKP